MRVSLTSVHEWLRLWREGGVQVPASRGPSGSRCQLSTRCLEKLAVYLKEVPAPRRLVEETVQVRDAARVATLTGRKFHVSCSTSGATRLMHRLGSTPQAPVWRGAERDEQAVTE